MANGLDQYFSVIALFIIFRETVEASIIVSVLLQFLHRSFPHLKKQVWWGVACGILVSTLFGVIFVCVYYLARENLFTGANRAIFKGSIAWFAGILITILAFAMLRYKGWEDKIRRKLEALAQRELDQQAGLIDDTPTTRIGKMKHSVSNCTRGCLTSVAAGCAACWGGVSNACAACWHHTGGAALRALPWKVCHPKPKDPTKSELVGDNMELAVTASHGFGIWLIVFSTVVREGVESVVFLAGVGNAQPSSLPLPGVVGFICGVAVGMFCYYSGKQVKDLKWFIIIMGVILFFIAAGQFLLGADFLITGGMFGFCSPWVNDRPWYMQPVWDLSNCCADVDSGKNDSTKFFALVRAIFGYQDKPTMIELCIYFGYWFIIILVAVYKYFNGSLFDADWKFKKQQAKEAKLQGQNTQVELASIDSGDDLQAVKKLDLPSSDQSDESDDGTKRASLSMQLAPPAGPLDAPTQQQNNHLRQ